jgi:hypothetical protein
MTNGMTVRLPTVRSIPAQSKRLAEVIDALNALASTAAHAGEGADDQVTLDRKLSDGLCVTASNGQCGAPCKWLCSQGRGSIELRRGCAT